MMRGIPSNALFGIIDLQSGNDMHDRPARCRLEGVGGHDDHIALASDNLRRGVDRSDGGKFWIFDYASLENKFHF